MERELAALERSAPAGRCVVHHFSGRRPYSVPAPRLLRRRPLPTAIVYHSRGVLSVRCAIPEQQQVSHGARRSGTQVTHGVLPANTLVSRGVRRRLVIGRCRLICSLVTGAAERVGKFISACLMCMCFVRANVTLLPHADLEQHFWTK